MSVPAELKYTEEHEWIRIEGDIATIGITDHAQGELGDIVYVELPDVGDEFSQGDTFGSIEAVKAVSDLYCPVSGTVTEINARLDSEPEVINSDAYGDGWMIRVQLANASDADGLLSNSDYERLIG